MDDILNKDKKTIKKYNDNLTVKSVLENPENYIIFVEDKTTMYDVPVFIVDKEKGNVLPMQQYDERFDDIIYNARPTEDNNGH